MPGRDGVAFFKACAYGEVASAFEMAPTVPHDHVSRAERALECLWSTDLHEMEEGRLVGTVGGPLHEAYRFLWLRSFDPAVVVRISRQESRVSLVVKTLDVTVDDRLPALRCMPERDLSAQQWTEFTRLLDAADFWTTSRHPRDETAYLDGASWILEGVRDGRHHLVYRDSPPAGDFRNVCLYIIEQAGIDEAAARVY